MTSRDPILDCQPGLPAGMWEVSLSLNGVKSQLYKLEEGEDFITWAANVSDYAQTLTQLQITLTTGLVPLVKRPPETAGVIVGVDNISFSPIAVPEPSTMMLLLLGLAAAVRQRARTSTGKDDSHVVPNPSSSPP